MKEDWNYRTSITISVVMFVVTVLLVLAIAVAR